MKNLQCKISIINRNGQSVSYDFLSEIEIFTALKKFTDTAKIVVPRKIAHDKKDISNYIARGDSIEIYLGYNSVQKVFEGYVTKVGNGMPIVIDCENKSYELKQQKISATYYESLTLKDFISQHMKDYDTVVSDINLGEVRINEETTLAKVFDYFASNYPLDFYFRENVFYAGLPTALLASNQKTIKLRSGYNYISDSLTYTRAEDMKIQVVAKAILPDNTKIETRLPENSEDADIKTFYVPGAKNENDLKVFASEKIKELKIDKMEGSLTAFGEPFIMKGDIIHLFNDKIKEQNDKKFIASAVNYMFGQGGYRQRITLGYEIH